MRADESRSDGKKTKSVVVRVRDASKPAVAVKKEVKKEVPGF